MRPASPQRAMPPNLYMRTVPHHARVAAHGLLVSSCSRLTRSAACVYASSGAHGGWNTVRDAILLAMRTTTDSEVRRFLDRAMRYYKGNAAGTTKFTALWLAIQVCFRLETTNVLLRRASALRQLCACMLPC